MCKKEAREHLGKLLKRFVLSYSIDKMDSSLSHEKILFFFIVRMFFPVMLVGVCLVTSFDIYFYLKYHYTSSYNDKKFLYLFPIPCVAPSFLVVNFIMSVATTIKLFCWDKEKKCWKSTNENTLLLNGHEELQDVNNIPENNNRENMNEESNREDKLKHHCRNILIFLTLVLLFGIVYLFYHGFWMIVALLAFPGRVLIGGIFIVPLILVTIPTWNTIIKITESFCKCCCKCCCKRCCKCCCNGETTSQSSDNFSYWNYCCEVCKWLSILIYELGFWGLFLLILLYISRFLLGSIDLENKTFQLAFSYITIAAFSGILVWLNTDLVTYPKDIKDEHEKNTNSSYEEIPSSTTTL